MINKVYSHNGLGIMSTYNKFNDPKQEEKQKAFAQALSSDKHKEKMSSIDTVLGDKASKAVANNARLNVDALFKLSDTAQTLKEMAEQFNVRHMSLDEMKNLGQKLYDHEMLSAYDFKEILKKSEDNINSQNNAQDLLGLWENKLKLLQENNSPRNLIDRAQQVIQVLKNLEAMHTEPITAA